jgi:hypothetical protein
VVWSWYYSQTVEKSQLDRRLMSRMRGRKASIEHLLSFGAQREIPSLCRSILGEADAHDDG